MKTLRCAVPAVLSAMLLACGVEAPPADEALGQSDQAVDVIAFKPTTTLANETGNNTSAADAFKAQSNGNLGASNVSKVSIRKLLYAGATTRIYAHLMPWFGPSNHMNVGYDSADPAQVARQLKDMKSRGIDGVMIDWYGPNSTHHDTATRNWRAEAEKNPGFEFAVMEDVGAIKKCGDTSGCDVTQRMIDDLNYAYAQYFGSPAYVRWNGRPVVAFFGVEAYPIDWTRARNGVKGNPLFVFRNSGAFSHVKSDGGFSWVGIASNPEDMGLGYLENFYDVAAKYPNALTVGSTYKGFDDTLAAWGKHRIVEQHCGQTWLSTFAKLREHYSAANPLDALQLVTWNDYEEGTELESGIDNCVSVSASVSGTKLTWALTGDEATLDHFEVFASQDGSALMKVTSPAASARSIDLAALHLASGNYSFLVKAVGQPGLRNHLSNAAAFGVQPPPASQRTITVSTLADGDTVLTPVHVAASASSPNPVTAMHIYVDDVKAYAVNASSLDTSLPLTPGAHRVTVQAWDSTGAVWKVNRTITAVNPGVELIAPVNGATVGSPMRVLGRAFAPKGITAMHIYLDYQKVYAVQDDQVDAQISVGAGSHNLTLQAWDAAGTVYKQTITVVR